MNDTKTEPKNHRGKYIKQLLTQLEREGVMTPAVRRLALDTFNDLVILEEDQYKKYLQQTGQTEEYLDLEEEGDAESETTI